VSIRLRLAACALTMSFACWTGVAFAQDGSATDQETLERQSRIHPSAGLEDQPPPFAPPTNNRIAPVEKPPSPEKVEPPVETSALIGALELCMKTVSPQFDVKPQVLLDSGWGYTGLQRQQRGALQYDKVEYLKGGLIISLQDFKSFVDCRVVARIRGADQTSEIRTSLITQFGASPVRETAGMAPYVARTEQAAPQTNFENLLVVGDYLVEFWQQQIGTAGLNVDGAPLIDVALLSISPLPEKYRMKNRTAAAQ
jgi:hypothetical protein